MKSYTTLYKKDGDVEWSVIKRKLTSNYGSHLKWNRGKCKNF